MRIATVVLRHERWPRWDQRLSIPLAPTFDPGCGADTDVSIALDYLGFENPEPYTIQSITYSEDDGL